MSDRMRVGRFKELLRLLYGLELGLYVLLRLFQRVEYALLGQELG